MARGDGTFLSRNLNVFWPNFRAAELLGLRWLNPEVLGAQDAPQMCGGRTLGSERGSQLGPGSLSVQLALSQAPLGRPVQLTARAGPWLSQDCESRNDSWSFPLTHVALNTCMSGGPGQLAGPSALDLGPLLGLHQPGGISMPHSPTITEQQFAHN